MPIRNEVWQPGTPAWIDCQVDDPVKAGEFYAQLFGWEIQGSDPGGGGYLMAAKSGAAAAGIGPKPDSMPGMPAVWTTYFAVEDAEAAAAKVTAAGGRLLMPTFDVMEFGRMFVAADPGDAVFAVWEAKAHNGAAVYNEHGAYCWNELRTRDLAAAKSFYADVFGFGYTDFKFGPAEYSIFTPPARTEGVGGLSDDSATAAATMPDYWLVWFQYDDVDAGIDTARELGGTVLQPAVDSPVGRSALIAGPQGEPFGIIDPNKRVGEMPAPIS
ncbi:VOC family protein [Nocardia australiensis]|uniref:VOC family protein n=1 Tax=Nocardia australiensis TaxID=2887191 RepID=UPI001D14E3CD|nr:VOC family protein [Nocardia australiensis]